VIKWACFAASALWVLSSTQIASSQGTYVTIGGQSHRAAARSYNRGRIAARRDLARGRLRIEDFGYPDDYVHAYGDILEREYGIQLDWVAACVVRPSLVSEVAGYNSIMVPAIERRFGKGILSQIEKRAIAGYEPVRPLPYDYFLEPAIPGSVLPVPTLPVVDLPAPPPPPRGQN
jgi:hypothetical protein